MSHIIQNGRVLDPLSNRDEKADLVITDGVIEAVVPSGSRKPKKGDDATDASGLLVTPGLIDMRVHVREPGEEYKEDIESAAQAAIHGGVTSLITTPDSHPPIDTPETVGFIKKRGVDVGLCRVIPTGALTMGLACKQLAEYASMQRAGAVALSNGDVAVRDSQLLRSALEYASDFNLPVCLHVEDTSLTMKGEMNEGAMSTQLGLRGSPSIAETSEVMRTLLLAEYTGAAVHLCHISTAASVEAIRQAKGRGVRVTAEACPLHFSLTEEDVGRFDTSTKVNPPLRSATDRDAIIAGLKDGTIDVIASDHAPQTPLEKDNTFSHAEVGAIGLQTLLPLSLQLHRQHNMPLLNVLERLTYGPAKILGLETGRIAEGAPADITLINPDKEWEFCTTSNKSKSANSPYMGQELVGRVEKTFVAGSLVYAG